MAHFRMNTQIREQTTSFLRGFRSIVNLEWLSLFSTPEVSDLLSVPSHYLNENNNVFITFVLYVAATVNFR